MMRPEPGIYGWSTGTGGVHYFRLAEPLRVAQDHGIRAFSGQTLDDGILARYDTVLTHMLWHPHASKAWQELARLGTHRLVLDVDDMMWAPDWAPFQAHYTPDVLRQVEDNLRVAHVVTTPSPILADHLAKFNANVHYVPNTIPAWLLHRHIHDRSTFPRVGYQGSPSHATDVDTSFERGVGRFLGHHRDWRLYIYGADPGAVPPHLAAQVRHLPWRSNLRDYYRTVSMDIGLGPLADTPFNHCKSGLRAIEYAALGVPAILSDSPAYRGWVEDGTTGFLVGTDWYDALVALAVDEQLRRKMSRTARERAAGWTTEANISRWTEAWSSA